MEKIRGNRSVLTVMYLGLVTVLLGGIVLIKSVLFIEMHLVAPSMIVIVIGVLFLLVGVFSDSKM